MVVVDLDSVTVVYALNPDASLEPASTEVAHATAAQRLGGGFRTATAVLGQGGWSAMTWRGDLVLKWVR